MSILRLWIQPVTNNRKGYIMKKSSLLFVLLSLGMSLFAQNVKMPALIDSIHNLSMPIKVLGYGGGNGKTWSGFNKTDRLDDGSVRDRYSNTTRYFTPNNGDVSGMNIEHIWANSWWGHIQNFAYKDLFNLYPSDATANQRKSNNPIGVVTASDAFDNGVVKVGKGIDPGDGTTQTVWEPSGRETLPVHISTWHRFTAILETLRFRQAKQGMNTRDCSCGLRPRDCVQ